MDLLDSEQGSLPEYQFRHQRVVSTNSESSLRHVLTSVFDSPSVAVPANRVSATRPSTTTCSAGYVPDGLSENEWDKIKKEKADQLAKNKKYYKEKKFEVGRCRQNGQLLRPRLGQAGRMK